MGQQHHMTPVSIAISHSKPWITEEDQHAVNTVLRSGMIAQGAMATEFENSVSTYLDVKAGVATASGTSALVLGLKALDISRDSEVIVPSYVCQNVLEAVITVGAVPVICDVGRDWVVTIKEIEPLITKHTAAIIAVHIFGLASDVSAIQSFGIPVIEDACQAFGLKVNGVPAGGLGDIGLLSFHATKCLTTAEGGMLVSNNSDLISRAKRLRDGDVPVGVRVPAPFSDVQAATRSF
jgi:perosamine synthetase